MYSEGGIVAFCGGLWYEYPCWVLQGVVTAYVAAKETTQRTLPTSDARFQCIERERRLLHSYFLSHVGFNLVYKLKWAMSGLFTIRSMYWIHFFVKSDLSHLESLFAWREKMYSEGDTSILRWFVIWIYALSTARCNNCVCGCQRNNTTHAAHQWYAISMHRKGEETPTHHSYFLSHVGFNLVYKLKWAMSGLFTIKSMYSIHFFVKSDSNHFGTWELKY